MYVSMEIDHILPNHHHQQILKFIILISDFLTCETKIRYKRKSQTTKMIARKPLWVLLGVTK